MLFKNQMSRDVFPFAQYPRRAKCHHSLPPPLSPTVCQKQRVAELEGLPNGQTVWLLSARVRKDQGSKGPPSPGCKQPTLAETLLLISSLVNMF